MSFTLIQGPMKSGKSLELIARTAPLAYAADMDVVYVQPKQNKREAKITSRVGIAVEAMVVKSLVEVPGRFNVISVDEINMFEDRKDAAAVAGWLLAKKEVIVSGLDLDYRGLLMPIMPMLHQLKPDLIITKYAVCDCCGTFPAHFSQILDNDKEILEGLDSYVPEDGTFEYQARCREHFVQAPQYRIST